MPATTTEPTSIEEQLRALVRLQYIDSRIHQINKLRGDLPEEIRDLEDEKTGLETRIENAKRHAKDGEVRKKKLALDIAESEGLIKKYEEQQLQVRNNREYDALTKEIEAQHQRIQESRLEMEDVDRTTEENLPMVEEAQERLNILSEILDEKQGELDTVVGETRAEEEAFLKQREAASSAIETYYLRAYERLRDRMRDGRAVVPVERGAAGGFQVPPQRQVEIRHRNRIIACEHTGRIIVDDALYRETISEVDS